MKVVDIGKILTQDIHMGVYPQLGFSILNSMDKIQYSREHSLLWVLLNDEIRWRHWSIE